MMPIHSMLVMTLCMAASAAIAQTSTPYAGQQSRDIKSLSAEEIEGYLAGRGMGLAKAAELNGFPGPMHVLELERQLALTADQRARTEALFAAMQSRARQLGRDLVDAERKLDRLFATRSVTADTLNRSLDEIGALQAKVRAAHLEAHLAQVAILTPEQTAKYATLRGYDAGAHGAHRTHGGHHK